MNTQYNCNVTFNTYKHVTHITQTFKEMNGLFSSLISDYT